MTEGDSGKAGFSCQRPSQLCSVSLGEWIVVSSRGAHDTRQLFMRRRRVSDQWATLRRTQLPLHNCQKAHGSAFRSRAAVKAADFEWVQGEELMTFYRSSPGNRRGFCRVCGSPILSKFEAHLNYYGLPLGALDDDPDIRPKLHVHVSSNAPWFTIGCSECGGAMRRNARAGITTAARGRLRCATGADEKKWIKGRKG